MNAPIIETVGVVPIPVENKCLATFLHLETIFRYYASKTSKHSELFLVGGSVRDILLGAPCTDLDFATNLTPKEIKEVLESCGIKYNTLGEKYGTIKTSIFYNSVEITTYRDNEEYNDKDRKPNVSFGSCLLEDLKRRDFTINAMALDSQGNLYDPFYGIIDLEKRTLCTPYFPEVTFKDDPLRMLRAARFSSKYPLLVSSKVFNATKNCKKYIHKVSGERIRTEFSKILTNKHPKLALEFLADTGLLSEIFPSFKSILDLRGVPQGKMHSKDIWEHTLSVIQNSPNNEISRWAALFHDIGKPANRTENESGVHFYGHEKEGEKIFLKESENLHFSNEDRDSIGFIIGNHMQPNSYDSSWTDTSLRRMVRHYGSLLQYGLDLSKADITSHKLEVVEEKLKLHKELCDRLSGLDMDISKPLVPKGLGDAIKEEFGIPEGKEVGSLIKKVSEAVLSGDLPQDASLEEAIEFIKEL